MNLAWAFLLRFWQILDILINNYMVTNSIHPRSAFREIADPANEGAHEEFVIEFVENEAYQAIEAEALANLREINRRKRNRIAQDWRKWSWLEEGF